MNVTHTKKHNGHHIRIDYDWDACGVKQKTETMIYGHGDTKHDAVKMALKAIDDLAGSLDRMREELHSL